MKTIKKILPGQPGTKKQVAEYGEKLLCVRYKYDPETNKKIKTVELIIDEKTFYKKYQRIPANKIVYVRVKYGEVNLSRIVKAAGGKWNRERKLWEISYKEVIELGLKHRMIKT